MNETVFISLPIEDLQTVIIDCVNSCLRNNKQETIPTYKPEKPLTVKEAAEFLNLAVPTIYGLVYNGKLSGMKPAKRRYFHKVELLNYLNQSSKKSLEEISSENDKYLVNFKIKKNNK
jgi:excisionase family DNA binding protein